MMTQHALKRFRAITLGWLSEPWPYLLAVLFGGGYVLFNVAKTIVEEQEKSNKIDVQLRRTAAGNFALDNFYECQKSGATFGSSPTTARCINETAAAANTLRGTQFANEVREALATKFVAATK